MTEPRWLTLARGEIGTLEIKGDKHNPKVVAYFKDAGFGGVKDDETAWCAAFVGAILSRCKIKPSGSLAARSYEEWGTRLDVPKLGCIGVKRRAGGKAWQGHVAFVVAANPTTVWMVGGNQADAVNVQAFSRWQFTAFRWPAGQPPTDAPLPSIAPGQAGSEA